MGRLLCDRFGVDSDSGLGVEASSGLPGKGEGHVCMICGEVMESVSSAKDSSELFCAVAHLTEVLLSLQALDLLIQFMFEPVCLVKRCLQSFTICVQFH